MAPRAYDRLVSLVACQGRHWNAIDVEPEIDVSSKVGCSPDKQTGVSAQSTVPRHIYRRAEPARFSHCACEKTTGDHNKQESSHAVLERLPNRRCSIFARR